MCFYSTRSVVIGYKLIPRSLIVYYPRPLALCTARPARWVEHGWWWWGGDSLVILQSCPLWAHRPDNTGEYRRVERKTLAHNRCSTSRLSLIVWAYYLFLLVISYDSCLYLSVAELATSYCIARLIDACCNWREVSSHDRFTCASIWKEPLSLMQIPGQGLSSKLNYGLNKAGNVPAAVKYWFLILGSHYYARK